MASLLVLLMLVFGNAFAPTANTSTAKETGKSALILLFLFGAVCFGVLWLYNHPTYAAVFFVKK